MRATLYFGSDNTDYPCTLVYVLFWTGLIRPRLFLSSCALCTRLFFHPFIFFPSHHIGFRFAFEKIFTRIADPGDALRDILLPVPPPSLLVAMMSYINSARDRLVQEQKLYAQENQDQKLKLDKFVANNADEWDIKNGVRWISIRPTRPFHPPPIPDYRPSCPEASDMWSVVYVGVKF